MRKKISVRRESENVRHLAKARFAARTAASTSSTEAKSTSPVWTPVAGLKTGRCGEICPLRAAVDPVRDPHHLAAALLRALVTHLGPASRLRQSARFEGAGASRRAARPSAGPHQGLSKVWQM